MKDGILLLGMSSAQVTKRWVDLDGGEQYGPYKKRQLYNFVREGKLRAFKLSPGAKLVIDLRDLDRLIENHPHDPRTRLDRVVDEVIEEIRP